MVSVGMCLLVRFWRKEQHASIPSLCGMLVHSDVTSSVTSRALSTGKSVKDGEFVKKICGVFDLGRYGAD